MADQDLARLVGRLEQQSENARKELGEVTAAHARVEYRVGRLEQLAHPFRRDIENLNIEARARGAQIDDHAKRIVSLELPGEQAKKDSATRRERMRSVVKRLGVVLGSAFALIEWVVKPIVGLIAETWWRGN